MTLEEAEKLVSEMRGTFSRLDEPTVCVDDWFTADQLEAIAIVMRSKADPSGVRSNGGKARDGVSDERLSQLVVFAEACSKPWIGVDVVVALKELRNRRAFGTSCDVCNGTEFVPVTVAPCEACYQRRVKAAEKASEVQK